MARGRGGSAGALVGGWLGRALWLVMAGALVWLAVAGGEYGTLDLLRQGARRDSVAAEVADLQRARDSLARALTAIRTDTATLERLAREEHGMVRGDKELLYRLPPRPATGSPPDSQ